MVAVLLNTLLVLSTGRISDKPALRVTAFPKLSVHQIGTGCSSVLLTAEITGRESEEWYCPRVEWRFPDGTTSMEESDCDPFADREEYPRRWTKRICAGEGWWTVTVRLSKSRRTLASTGVDFIVQ